MKWMPVFLLMSFSCFSQARYNETKVSQVLRPDPSIASTAIVTKVFAKEADSEAWIVVYESEVAVARTKHAKKVKEGERLKAEAAGREFLAAQDAPPAIEVRHDEPLMTK
jgi:hypothetical protein